jgi:hypothetical protein
MREGFPQDMAMSNASTNFFGKELHGAHLVDEHRLSAVEGPQNSGNPDIFKLPDVYMIFADRRPLRQLRAGQHAFLPGHDIVYFEALTHPA